MKKYLLLANAIFFILNLSAQTTKTIYYDSSTQLYSIEKWNAKKTRAHFKLYFPDGKLKADGYKKKDRLLHRYELPDSFFVAYNETGLLIQRMTMNRDSITVNTYDDSGIFREKILATKNYCYEDRYYDNGVLMNRFESFLPPKKNFFKDYYSPNKSKKSPSAISLFPVRYGTS